jgi:hypothetical protein
MYAFGAASIRRRVAARYRVAALSCALVLAAGALVTAMSWHSSSSAAGHAGYPPSPGCSIATPAGVSVTPGKPVTLIGSNFAANEQVGLSVDHTRLSTVSTDGDGALRTTVRIPDDQSNGPASDGRYVVTAHAPSGSCSIEATSVTPSPGTSPSSNYGAGAMTLSKPAASQPIGSQPAAPQPAAPQQTAPQQTATQQTGASSAGKSTAAGSTLASTGFQSATAIGVGVVIIGSGVVLLLIGRRKA